jgi:hypothetical protein
MVMLIHRNPEVLGPFMSGCADCHMQAKRVTKQVWMIVYGSLRGGAPPPGSAMVNWEGSESDPGAGKANDAPWIDFESANIASMMSILLSR